MLFCMITLVQIYLRIKETQQTMCVNVDCLYNERILLTDLIT